MSQMPGMLPPAPMGDQQYFVQFLGPQNGPLSIPQLQQLAMDGQLRGDSLIAPASNPQAWMQAKAIPGLFSTQEWLTILLVSIFVGSLGVDRFMLGQVGMGIAKLVTMGGCGVWSLIDVILIAMRKVTDSEGRPLA